MLGCARTEQPQPLRRILLWLAALGCGAMLSACGGGSADTTDPTPASPQAGFSLEVTPASALAFAGSGRVLTVTLARTGGFTADVTVALSNPPAGATAEAVTFTGGVASLPLSVTLDATVAPGNLALSFDATSGSSHASATAQVSVQAAQPRAQGKIADALAAGRIDRDTSLLYRLYALAGDPRLPDDFVGSGGDEEDLPLFSEIEQALPQMSAAMRAAAHPFLVRPDHPDSVYRRPGTASARNHLLSAHGEHPRAAAAPPASDCAAGVQWRSSRSTLIPVRVWIIHEFFHVLQFAHNAELSGGWLAESTARWSESHFDRVLAWPQRVALTKVHKPWFNSFIKTDSRLDWPKEYHPYASYIWPFFLEQETGGPGIIGQLWTALEAAGGLADENRIIDAAYGFHANFHRFAVRNVNEELLPGDPLKKRYIDLAGIRDGSVAIAVGW